MTQAFPFSSFESLTRSDVEAQGRLGRAVRRKVHLERLGRALADLAGEPIELLLRKVRNARGSQATDAVALLLAEPGEPDPARRLLLEVEGSLARDLLARALHQPGPALGDPSRAAGAPIAGGMAALAAFAIRKAHAGIPMHVVAAGPAPVLSRNFLATALQSCTAHFTLVVGANAYDAKVTVADSVWSASEASSAETLDVRARLRDLGAAQLGLPLVACTILCARETLATLRPGDALVTSECPLTSSGGSIEGPAALCAPRSGRAIMVALARGGRLVVRGAGRCPMDTVDAPTHDETSTGPLDGVEDIPVVVRVELGFVELSASQWAELAPGDVLSLGRRLGDPATLRVGGSTVGYGELVLVDGEYAVRLSGRKGK